MRTDIQGLRAITVVAVVLWHAGLPVVPGGFVGVDVFFVISGFLTTQMLIREHERSGRIRIARFYARRIRRLLPAAATCLAGVLALSWLFLPANRWRGIGMDIIASAGQVVNWRLASRSVDYLAEGSAASPVQHFWSLSVEEQFFACWPLLLALAGWVALRRGLSVRLVVGMALLTATTTSYTWSVGYSTLQPARAYFVTTTRLWELGLGGLVAVLGPWLAARRLPQGGANALAGAGLAGVLGSLALLDASTTFPGWVAIVPTLGTALVIAAAPSTGGRANPTTPLAAVPLQWLGGLSYSLYLWHWPLLVAAAARTESGRLNPAVGALVAAAALVPAWISLHLVEDPLRRPGRHARIGRAAALRIGVACTAVSLVTGAALVVDTAVEARHDRRLAAATPAAPALAPTAHFVPVNSVRYFVPSPVIAPGDVFHPWYDGKCSPAVTSDVPLVCRYGDRAGSYRVVLVGDSHAVMWLPALTVIARQRHWRLDVIAKSNCALADTTLIRGTSPNQPCARWNATVMRALADDPPDLVIAGQVSDYRVAGPHGTLPLEAGRVAFGEALARTWRQLQAAGSRVVTIVDGPRFERDEVECAAGHQHSLRVCAAAKASVLIEHNTAQRLALSLAPQVGAIDLTGWLCPGDTCPAVIGNLLLYRDNNHISATYAHSLTRQLAKALDQVAGQRPVH